MIKGIILGLSCATLMSSSSHTKADWLDDLTKMVGREQVWKTAEAETLVEECIGRDEKRIKELEEKIEGIGKGFWAAVHWSSYKAELLNARSTKSYHEKLLKAFKQFPENKKDREKMVESLVTLYRYKKELKELKKEYGQVQGISEKTKLWARIKAKETQILAKRSMLKSSFLLS